MIQDTKSAQISHKQDGHNIHVIIKTMCPPGYHHIYGGHIVLMITLYYSHLPCVRFEHSVCRGSLMATYIMLFT